MCGLPPRCVSACILTLRSFLFFLLGLRLRHLSHEETFASLAWGVAKRRFSFCLPELRAWHHEVSHVGETTFGVFFLLSFLSRGRRRRGVALLEDVRLRTLRRGRFMNGATSAVWRFRIFVWGSPALRSRLCESCCALGDRVILFFDRGGFLAVRTSQHLFVSVVQPRRRRIVGFRETRPFRDKLRFFKRCCDTSLSHRIRPFCRSQKPGVRKC